ncbi:MAG TPA: radical SAM protein, partial [Candidatus Marinimicrobia bacterium]|nr:radical SAM protein [Candidatus Neomarinimicrobiota bacterium]
MTTINTARLTRSGLMVKNDEDLGFLVFSPYTGLIHAIHEKLSLSVEKWLNKSSKVTVPDSIVNALGPGWKVNISDGVFTSPHLLPEKSTWTWVNPPRFPIVVNWLITGNCPLECKYCFAEDLMRDERNEPDIKQLQQTAKSILHLNPLVVVLTGGDPLMSPHLEFIITTLAGKVGIIIDTSAYVLSNKHIKLFKRHKVVVRISIDSERPKKGHEAQRVLYRKYTGSRKRGSTLTAALSGLCSCLDAGVSVTVQTVATKKTANDLMGLGDKLFKLGVGFWRIFKVAPSKANMSNYLRLVGKRYDNDKPVHGKASRGPYEHIFKMIQGAHNFHWKKKMAIQTSQSTSPNAVILVSPDG